MGQQSTPSQAENVHASSISTSTTAVLPITSPASTTETRRDEHDGDAHELSTPPRSERVSDKEQSDAGEEAHMGSYDICFYSPPDGWVLNSTIYMEKVASLIKNNFLKTSQKADLYAFTERRCRAENKSTKEEREFWTKADPNIDAWMLVTGRKQDVFDISSCPKDRQRACSDDAMSRHCCCSKS